VLDSSENNCIIENTLSNNDNGLYLYDSAHNSIIENTITDNQDHGIMLGFSSKYNSISGNTITNNWFGIALYDASNHNSITGNTIANNDAGIFLDDSCNNNSISENTITENYEHGIVLDSSENNTIAENIITDNKHGIFLFDASDCNTITGNIIANNGDGIVIISSKENTISGNNITNNKEGIVLSGSLNTVIYHNNIIDNIVQAYDETPEDNHWHHPDLLEGNYWSDYPGVDDGSGAGKHAIAGDGIGDTYIPWPTDSYDFYPLMWPTIYTPSGTSVKSTDPVTEVTVTFDEVTSGGTTRVTASDTGPDPPAGFEVNGQYYDITTTANYTGTITIAIPYDETQVVGSERDLKLMHWNPKAEQWEDVTTWVDTENNIIYGEVESLSIFTVMEPVIEVTIDIKPGSYPNSINLKSKGVVPVAVLTTDDFDASTVDPVTVRFANATPVRWTMKDVDGDGDLDLLLHFKTQELNLDENSTEATLTGNTYDGTPIQGTDTINIVPKGKGKGK